MLEALSPLWRFIGVLIAVFIIAAPPLVTVSTLVLGVTGIKYFGWKTRYGLMSLNITVLGLYGPYPAYLTYRWVRPSPFSIAVFVLGLFGGLVFGLFMTSRLPRWRGAPVGLWQVLAATLMTLLIGLALIRF